MFISDSNIVEMSPYLSRYALKLTRNKSDAEDLLQSTLLVMIEKVRKEDVFIENLKPYIAKVMYYQWIHSFVKRNKSINNECEYRDYMHYVLPEMNIIGLFSEADRLIKRNKPHNQKMLLEFIRGEDYPKYKKATKDFKYEIKKYVNS